MSSAELMRDYCNGKDAAFERLYAQVAPRLRSYLRVLVRDASAADDLLQQTFLKLHVARGAYIEGADPVPWIYSIAHRTCIDEMRRRRRTHVRLQQGAEVLPELEAGFSGTAVGAECDEPYSASDRERVLEALQWLPQDQRAAVVLTKLGGKSVAEAATIAGTTPSAMKLRAHRAYGKLRALLESEDALAPAPLAAVA
jgi:RNA polymerase sigma-70 factor, ECF subfamily